VAGVAVLNRQAIRRVLRLRSLIAGPLAMEKHLQHDPVMIEEIDRLFALKPESVVADGTLGLGGHSSRFLSHLGPKGALVATDWDASMLERARERLVGQSPARLELFHSDFRELPSLLEKLGLMADGYLLDLGLNSAQVDDPDRGMSFREDGPLDMRMDRSRGEPASSMLNRMALGEIESALWEYGDERWARMIARKIVERRKRQPLRTTEDLVECVLAAIPPGARDRRIHPATRTFQAIRILVNFELTELDTALKDAAARLAPNGVLAVLSYHSGEDRIVKNTFRALADEGGYEEMFRKPETATDEEIRRNPRSRSAKLRALRRVTKTGNDQ